MPSEISLTPNNGVQSDDAILDIFKRFGTIALIANSEERVKAIYEVLVDKFVKRKLSLKFLDKKDPQPAGGHSKKRRRICPRPTDGRTTPSSPPFTARSAAWPGSRRD